MDVDAIDMYPAGTVVDFKRACAHAVWGMANVVSWKLYFTGGILPQDRCQAPSQICRQALSNQTPPIPVEQFQPLNVSCRQKNLHAELLPEQTRTVSSSFCG